MPSTVGSPVLNSSASTHSCLRSASSASARRRCSLACLVRPSMVMALAGIGCPFPATARLLGLLIGQLLEQPAQMVRQRFCHHVGPCDPQAHGDKVVRSWLPLQHVTN